MGFDYFKEPRSVFAVREGERSMKDTVHPAVHRSVHFCGERKLCGALRLRFTRRLILDTGKTPEWAGATPLFATYSWRKNRWGRSSPHVLREARLGMRVNKYAAINPEEL